MQFPIFFVFMRFATSRAFHVSYSHFIGFGPEIFLGIRIFVPCEQFYFHDIGIRIQSFLAFFFLQEHIFRFVRSYPRRHSSDFDEILEFFWESHVKTQQSLFIVVESYIDPPNTFFQGLDMGSIMSYKVKIFVPKRIIFSGQSHKFGVISEGVDIRQLEHYEIVVVECVSLKFLFYGITDSKCHDIGGIRGRVVLFGQGCIG